MTLQQPASSSARRPLFRFATTAVLLWLVAAGCSDGSDGSDDSGAKCPTVSGPVSGEEDAHCSESDGTPVTQEIGACMADGEGDLGAGGASSDEPFEVRYGQQAYDDDCKYLVKFENSCVVKGQPVTFKVTLTRKSDGKPATGATPDSPEIYLSSDSSHISPSNQIKAPESPGGVYAIGPIVFDQSGRWVVRFHFFETCSDIPEDSPHAHVAFYIDVP